jgi:uncharacterized OsmC-like protein
MDTEHIRSSIVRVVEHLKQNPSAATSKNSAAIAVIEGGLRCRASGPNGAVITTDLPKAMGGEGEGPSPGWVLRAALSTCNATMIALRAAVEGVSLTQLEVTVDSDSDDRGVVGADDAAPPGPLRIRVHIRVASDAPAEKLRRIVNWAEAHSPVGDALRRAVPTSMTIVGS